MNKKMAKSDRSLTVPANPQLLLWVEDASLGETLSALLKTQFSLVVLEGFSELELELELAKNSAGSPPILLLCRGPVEHVCQSVLQGSDPKVTLAQWEAQMRAILAVHRHNRDRVQILDGGMIGRDPAAFLHHYGLAATKEFVERLSATAPEDPVLSALAQTSLLLDVRTRSLVGEFNAASVAFSEGKTQSISSASILSACVQRQHDLQGLELLHNQQRSMYGQLESLYTEKLQAEQHLDRYQERFRDLEGENSALKDEIERIMGSRAFRLMLPLWRLLSILGRGR